MEKKGECVSDNKSTRVGKTAPSLRRGSPTPTQRDKSTVHLQYIYMDDIHERERRVIVIILLSHEVIVIITV